MRNIFFLLLLIPFFGQAQIVDRFTRFGDSDPILGIGDVVASWREEAWSGTGAAGTWTDSSGNGHDIPVASGSPTVQSASTWQVYYDGTDDSHALATDDPDFDFVPGTDSWTIAIKLGNTAPTRAFVNTGGFLVNKGTFNGGSEYQYSIAYANTNQFYIFAGGDLSNFSYNPVAEDEIIVVFTASDVSLYVNGSQVGTTTAYSGTFTTPQTFSIAARNSGTNWESEVYIRDVIVFSKALNASERTTVFDNI